MNSCFAKAALGQDRVLEYFPEIKRHRQAKTCDAFFDFWEKHNI